jgi:hypothetical protein
MKTMRSFAGTYEKHVSGWRRRGASLIGIFFLLGIIGIFAMIYVLTQRNERQAAVQLRANLGDPKTALERFIIERSVRREFKDKSWKILLEYQTREDLAWMEKNRALLAGMNDRMPGIAASIATPDEQQFAALETLLDFGPHATRPVVSTVETHGDYAIAYYHQPNDATTMKPGFLKRSSGGEWQVMRFLGGRDTHRVMTQLATNKMWSGVALDDDEKLFRQDAAGYPAKKLNQLYALVGLPPAPLPAGSVAAPAVAATPTPAAPDGDPTPLPTPTPLAP